MQTLMPSKFRKYFESIKHYRQSHPSQYLKSYDGRSNVSIYTPSDINGNYWCIHGFSLNLPKGDRNSRNNMNKVTLFPIIYIYYIAEQTSLRSLGMKLEKIRSFL